MLYINYKSSTTVYRAIIIFMGVFYTYSVITWKCNFKLHTHRVKQIFYLKLNFLQTMHNSTVSTYLTLH